jgi:hypothetical protein
MHTPPGEFEMTKLSIALLLFLASCSAQQILTSPSNDLRRVNQSIQVKVTGEADKELIASLTREIKGQLVIAGFDIETQTDRKLTLNVNVSRFTPGNAALRWTVGFGAGRGSLVYSAQYVDTDGKILASMDGQERFTGQEVDFNTNYGVVTTMGGEDTVRTVLAKEAGKHIVELGVKPTEATRAAKRAESPDADFKPRGSNFGK